MIGRDGNRQDAQRLTEEIDAATNVATAANEMAVQTEVEAAKAGNLGAGVLENLEGGASEPNLDSTRAELGRKIISSADVEATETAAEQVQMMAERDNGYGDEYQPGVSTVGEESEEQIKMRLAQEAQNRWNEDHPSESNSAKIVARSQEEHGKAAAKEVGSFLSKKGYEVNSLEKWYKERRNQALLDFENPHPIGSGN